MSDLAFVLVAVLAALAWSLLSLVRRAHRHGTLNAAAARRRLVRLIRHRRRRNLNVSIAARGAWMQSLAAAYTPGPGRVVMRRYEFVVLVTALLAVAGAEVVIAFGPVLLGQLLAAALVPVLVLGVPERLGSEGLRSARRLNLALRALALVPLSRVIGVAIAHPDVSREASTLAVGVLICWLALRVAPALEIQRITLFALPLQGGPLLAGYLLSLVAYLGGAPVLVSDGVSSSRVAIGVAGVIFAAAAEELVFRGVLQGTLQRAAGRPGVIMGAGLFPVTYLGFGSLPLALVMLLASLLFANTVMRTGATAAVILGHAILALGASIVWPLLIGRVHPDWIDPAVLSAGLALVSGGVLWRILRGRGASLSIIRGSEHPRPAAGQQPDWFADA